MKYLLSVIIFFTLLFVTATSASAQVKLNEILIDGNPEWVEFHNSSASAEYIKGYYLDDDSNFAEDNENSNKILLTQLSVANVTFPTIDLSTFFNNSGDQVVLFDSSGQIVDQYEYIQNPGGDRALGKKPDGNGSFYKMTTSTKGSTNAEIYQEPSPTPSPSPSPNPSPTPSLSPSPSPSLLPSQSPSPSPKPSLKPSVKPSPQRSPISFSSEEPTGGQILGIGSDPTSSPTPLAQSQEKKKFPLSAIVFITGGLSLVGLSIYMFFRNAQNQYNETEDQTSN